MNDFLPVRVAALENRLSAWAQPHREYIASDEFLVRSAQVSEGFAREEALCDRVAVTLYMLQRLALSPKDFEDGKQRLARGNVLFRYFGVSNPVAMFDVAVGSAEHAALTAAFAANRESKMFYAALLVLRQRDYPKANARRAREDALFKRYRAELTWPTIQDRDKDSQFARAWYAESLEKLNARIGSIREHRQQRIAKISRATHAPEFSNWHTLLEAVAVNVFSATPTAKIAPSMISKEPCEAEPARRPRMRS